MKQQQHSVLTDQELRDGLLVRFESVGPVFATRDGKRWIRINGLAIPYEKAFEMVVGVGVFPSDVDEVEDEGEEGDAAEHEE